MNHLGGEGGGRLDRSFCFILFYFNTIKKFKNYCCPTTTQVNLVSRYPPPMFFSKPFWFLNFHCSNRGQGSNNRLTFWVIPQTLQRSRQDHVGRSSDRWVMQGAHMRPHTPPQFLPVTYELVLT